MPVVWQAVCQAGGGAQLSADVDACKKPPTVSNGSQALSSANNCSQDLSQCHDITTTIPSPDQVNVL